MLNISAEPQYDTSASFKYQYPCSLYKFQWFLGLGLTVSKFLICAIEDNTYKYN